MLQLGNVYMKYFWVKGAILALGCSPPSSHTFKHPPPKKKI